MAQRRTTTDNEHISARQPKISLRPRSKGTGSSPLKPVIGRRKGRGVGQLPHARDTNPSEADDEDGWAESSTHEADRRAHIVATSQTAVKRRSSHSASGAVLNSERDRTPQANKRFQLRLGTSERSNSPTDRSGDPVIVPLEEMVTPRATVSGTNRGTGNVTRSSGSEMMDCDRSLAEVEHTQDPRKFYALDSPVFNNSDSDQLYESAKETLELVNQGDEQVGGVGLHSSPTTQSPSTPLSGLPAQPTSPRPQPPQLPLAQSLLPSWPQANPSQPPLFQHQPRVTQRHGISLENHSSGDDVRQGCHPRVLPHETLERNPLGVGSRGQKTRRRSPQRRGGENKALAKLVRDELASLLAANSPYGRTPEPSQLIAFTAEWKRTGHGAKACNATTTDFMIDIANTPRSPWNLSAGRVFTSHIIEKMGYEDIEETRKALEKAFYTRFKSLKLRRNKDGLSQAERAAEKSKHSRYQRKYQLFQRRREIAKQYGPLLQHLTFLDALGVDGMSSDESDMDPTTDQRKYTVVKPDWRHPDLHNWLGVFDQLHHSSHLNSWSNDRRGAFPHIRVGSRKIHKEAHPPPGLPVNAYDDEWLEGRETMYLKYVLCPKAEPYDFSHSLALIQLLNRQS